MFSGDTATDITNFNTLDNLLIKPKLVAIFGALLPGIGCYVCIVYTFVFHFQRVENFTVPVCPGMHSLLPPVSYIIGVWEPTRTLWLYVMFVNSPIRLFYPFLYKHLYKTGNSKHMHSWWYNKLHQCFVGTMLLETFALLTITVFDVTSRFYIHAIAFGLWLITLNFNMLASILLHYFSGISKISSKSNRLFQIKLVFFFAGTALSLSTTYTYLYSTTKCSQSVYLLFSLTEYVLVGINSLFHFLLYWDCSKMRLGLKMHKLDVPKTCVGRDGIKPKNLLFCINVRKK